MASAAKTLVDSASVEVESSSSSFADGYYRAARGEVFDAKSDQTIQGFDAERMRARTILTAEEERKLIRRIDWHLMPLCSLMFLFKNMDSDNVSFSSSSSTADFCSHRLEGFKCSDYEPRNSSEHHDSTRVDI